MRATASQTGKASSGHTPGVLLRVVAVDLDRYKSDADRFLARLHPDFDVIFGPQGSLAERFNVHGMPTSVLIDRHGTVRFTHIGFRPADAALIEDAARSGSSPGSATSSRVGTCS